MSKVPRDKPIELFGFSSDDTRKGKQAEYYVCYDLVRQGHNSYIAAEGLSYDIITHTALGINSVQVKSNHTFSSSYSFGLLRCSIYGRRLEPTINNQSITKKNYMKSITDIPITIKDCNFLALVAMDIKKIAYIRTSDITTDGYNLPKSISIKKNEFDRYSKFPTDVVVEQNGRKIDSSLKHMCTLDTFQ